MLSARTVESTRVSAEAQRVRFRKGATMERASEDDVLLTVADVAGRIGCHEGTVRDWIRMGELQATQHGSRIGYRIEVAEFRAFMRRRQVLGVVSRTLLSGATTGMAGEG